MSSEYDIIIIGGGMTGGSFACSLPGDAFRIAIIESTPPDHDIQPSFDDRGLALSLSSKRVLESAGLWSTLLTHACPIQHIHVSDQGHFGFVRLDAADSGFEAFGHVVIAKALGQAVNARISESPDIDFYCPFTVDDIAIENDDVAVTVIDEKDKQILTAKLLVIADGSYSVTRNRIGIHSRIKEYGQSAIVSNILPTFDHENTAYERFTKNGPLALLPLHDQRCKLVYSVPATELNVYMEMTDQDFLQAIEDGFGKRLGRLKSLGKRVSYPLALVKPERQVKHRTVLLGNSAHTVHPNAAQGFNLCLRDIAMLAELVHVHKEQGEDIGSVGLLQEYVISRESDQQQVMRFTDELAALFYNDDIAKVFSRNIAMMTLDLFPGIKQALAGRAMGLSGTQAATIRAF